MGTEIEAPQRPKGKREVEIEKTADWLFLPQESLKNRTVRGYVEIARDVMALRKQFVQESQHSDIQILNDFPVTETYRKVRHLLYAEEEMLSYGFIQQVDIGKSVRDGISSLNIRTFNSGNVIFSHESPTDVWAKKPERYALRPDFSSVPPSERKDAFHQGRVREEGKALGFAEDALWHTPYHTFLTMLIDTKTLLNRQERAVELSSEPGLAPSFTERLRSVSHLTRGVLMLLEESVEQPLDRGKFAQQLNLGLRSYDIAVEPFLKR